MISRGFRPGRRFRAARVWSNQVLRQIAPLFAGDILNVSGWDDEDKEGGRYRGYFTNARSYAITNYGGFRGAVRPGDISLDLERDLPAELVGTADVVFNHTTLEHVFDVFQAVRNLCALTRDVVIIVVPAIQEEHTSESFGDYWRFTTGGVRRLLDVNGLAIVALTSSPYRDAAVYHLAVASRHPEKWVERIPALPAPNGGADFFRESLLERLVHRWRARGRSD